MHYSVFPAKKSALPNIATQSIDPFDMTSNVPTMSLFPFWSRILASKYHMLPLVVVFLNQFGQYFILTLILMHVPDSLKEH